MRIALKKYQLYMMKDLMKTEEPLRLEIEDALKLYEEKDPFMAFMMINETYHCINDSGEKMNFHYQELDDKVSMLLDDGKNKKNYVISCQSELETIINKYDIGLRICDECGCPMVSGYTNEDGDYHFCSDYEYEIFMDSLYGKNMWRSEPTGKKEWNMEYFKDGEWKKETSYYTEW